MLGELERKFVSINMILVGLVLIVVFTYMCVTSYDSRVHEGYRSLNENLRKRKSDNETKNNTNETSKNGNIIEIGKTNSFGVKEDRNRNMDTVVVNVSSRGTILEVYDSNNVTMAADSLRLAVESVIASKEDQGQLTEQNLLYVKKTAEKRYGTVDIAFGDYSSFIQIEDDIGMAIQVITIAMVAFFLISLLLAKMAFTPVQQVWNQQQQFVADASHELKTPLTVILANHNILQSHPNQTIKSQEKWINSTYEETIHMKKLVEDLLFLAKTDAKRVNVVLSEINISELIIGIILQFEPVAFEKNVDMDYKIEPDIMVKGDMTQLKQLVHILLDNALKYVNENGKVFLKLLMHQSFIVLSVSNTGKPIKQEDKPHLFERFYRSDKARSREGGYGLGLSIAKSIVDTHKGSISVSDDEEYGTTFKVKLPRSVQNIVKSKKKNKKK